MQRYYIDEKKSEMFRIANTIAINLMITGFFDGNDSTDYLKTINAVSDGRVLITDDRGTVLYDTNGLETGKLYASKEIISSLKGQTSYIYSKKLNIGKVIVPIQNKSDGKIKGVVLLTSSYGSISKGSERMRNITYLIVMSLAVLVFLLSFTFSGAFTKPFQQLIAHMNRVTDGHVDEQIRIKGNYEIQEIATTFNHMINRLAEIDDNRQQFVANVSHELKTPLSSVKVLAESLLSQDDLPIEIYKEFLTDINNEVDRENKIINDLLVLVTLDKKENALKLTDIDINALIESILKRLKPLANQKNIQMIFESFRQVICEVDETKITLAIMNLIENAIKYNRQYGYINVQLNADYKYMYITVKDTGEGIPEESIDKIFQRFYRVDKTRSRDTGGTGLGLSIVQKTVLMHKGTIKCESEVDKWTKFSMKIPLKQKGA